jgi:hypothetical protein
MEPVPLPPENSESAPTTNHMAIISMVAGIAGFLSFSIVFEDIFICVVLLASICAIVCGHIARRQIRKSKGLEQGKGIALTGLILGYALPVVLAILAAIVICVLMFILGEVAEGVFNATGDFWDSLQTIGQ